MASLGRLNIRMSNKPGDPAQSLAAIDNPGGVNCHVGQNRFCHHPQHKQQRENPNEETWCEQGWKVIAQLFQFANLPTKKWRPSTIGSTKYL